MTAANPCTPKTRDLRLPHVSPVSAGDDLKATYIATHDDIQAKLIAAKGKGGYDIITYYQGYKPLYRELNLLSPLDPAQVPNMKNLYPYFQGDQGNFWVEPDGTRTGVPW